jgi:outer membrane protein TolC
MKRRTPPAPLLQIVAMLAGGAALAAEPLSLRDAVRRALVRSPVIQSVRATQSVRRLEHRNSFAQLLPSLDLTNTNSITNPGTSSRQLSQTTTSLGLLGLKLSENLYDSGVSLTNVAVTGLADRIGELNFLKTRDSITLEIATAFYRYSLASAVLDVRQQQKEILGKQFDTASAEYREGLKTKKDVIRFRTQVLRSETSWLSARNDRDLVITDLRRLLGADPAGAEPLEFRIIPPPDVNDTPPKFEFRAKLDTSYEFRISELQSRIYGETADLERRRYRPEITATADVGVPTGKYFGPSATPLSTGLLQWNVALTLKYNLWDWGFRSRAVEIAQDTRDALNFDLRDQLLQTEKSIENLKAELQRLRTTYQLSRELLQLESENYKYLETQYKQGKVAYLDLITSLDNLLAAKEQYFASHFGLLQSLAQQKYFDGSLFLEFE